MHAFWYSLSLLFCSQLVVCRDFYIGMFKRNDYLVAQDVVYKAASPFGYAITTYGRLFKCPITYFRVVDRLGMGRGPYTSIVRGGLRKNYISVRIKSTYNLPISVNIYVGCANKAPTTIRRLTRATVVETSTNASVADSTGGDAGGDATGDAAADVTADPAGGAAGAENGAAGEPTENPD